MIDEELRKRLQNLTKVNPTIRVSAQNNQPIRVPFAPGKAPEPPKVQVTPQKTAQVLKVAPTAPKVVTVQAPKVPRQAPKVDTRSFVQKAISQVNPFDQGVSFKTPAPVERADKRPIWSKVLAQVSPFDKGETFTKQAPGRKLSWAERNINATAIPRAARFVGQALAQVPVTMGLSAGEVTKGLSRDEKSAQSALNIPYEQRRAIIQASRQMTPDEVIRGGDPTNPLDYRNPNYALATFFRETGLDPTDENLRKYIQAEQTRRDTRLTYQPEGRVAQAVFGKEPVKSYQQMGEEAGQFAAAKTGIPQLEKAGPLLAAGMFFLDLPSRGLGGVTRAGIKQLVKAETVDEVLSIAEKQGIKLTAEEAEALAKAGTQKEVRTVVRGAQEANKAVEAAIKATPETTEATVNKLVKTTSERTTNSFVKNTFSNLDEATQQSVSTALKEATDADTVRNILVNAKAADDAAVKAATEATAEQAAPDAIKVIEDKMSRNEKLTSKETQDLLDYNTKTQVTETTGEVTTEVPAPKTKAPEKVEPVYPPKLRKKIAEGKPLSPEEEMIKADIESGKGKVGINLRRKLNLGIPLSKREATKARKAGFEIVIDPELAKLRNEYIGPAKIHGFSKFWVTTKGLMSRLGDTGEVIAKRLSAMRDAVELGQNEFFNMIPTVNKITKGIGSKKEFKQFVDALEALSRGETPRMTARVAQAVKEWNAAIPLIRERARAAGIDVGDLGENYFPRIYDLDKRSNFNKAVDFLVSTNQAETRGQAENILNQMRTDQLKNGMFSSFKKRTVELPDYDKTPSAMVRYLEGAFDNIARKEQFGANNEVITYLLERIGTQYGVKAQEAAAKLWNIASKQGDNYSQNAMKASSLIRQFNSLTKLGTAAVTNLGQNINTITSYGTKNYFESLYKYFFTPDGKKFKNETGVALDRVLENTKVNMGVTRGAIGKISVPGFNAVETFNRNLAAEAAKNYAERQARVAAGGGPFAARAQRRLQEMGITGDIGAKLTPEQQIQAARKGVETTQFKIDPMDLPPWMDSPLGKTVAQFKTFAYKQTGYLYNEVVKRALKGDMMPLIRFMSIAPVLGNAIGDTRAAITGYEQEEKSPFQWYVEGLSNVGGLGLGLNDIRMIYENRESAKLPSMLASTVLGPTAGNFTELANNIAKGIGQGYWSPLGRQGVKSVPVISPISGRLNKALFPFKGPQTVTAPTGEKVKVKFPEGASEAQKAFLIEKAVGKKKGEEYLKGLPEETRAYVEGTQESLDTLLANNQLDKGTYNSIMKARKQLDILTGKTKYIKPAGMRQSTADYLQEINNLTDEEFNATQYDIPSDAGKKIIDDLNAKLPAGVQKLPYTNGVAREYANFEKKWFGGDTPLKDKGVVAQKTAVKSLWKDMITMSVSPEIKDTYNAGSNIDDYISEGLITKSMLDEAIALDDMLYKAGISGLKFSKKVRSEYGYGTPARAGEGKAKKVGLSKYDLSIPSIPKVPKFSPLSDVKMEMPTPLSSGQTSKISIKL